MRRQWHVLKGNKGCETAQNCIYFDTETKPEKMPDGSERDHLWFGWACAKSRTSLGNWGPGRWSRFTKRKQFWDMIDDTVRAKSRWFIFCHNTSYDLPVVDLFAEAAKRGWELTTAVIEAPPTIIVFRRDSATITFLDTLNWWPMKLETIGKHLGFPKLKMPERSAPQADWDTYCIRDVDVIALRVETWLDYLIKYDMGGFAMTIAGQAFRTFRHRFMDHEIVIDGDEGSNEVARNSYHGGRVECFRLGKIKGPIHAFDINWMYPAVMRRNAYPHKLLGHYPRQDRSRWRGLVRDYCIVARCRVRAAMPCYPLPTKNGLAFPTGEFETVLTTPEISLALKRGELLDMWDIVVYEKAPIFRRYVQFFWKHRRRCELTGDPVLGDQFKKQGNTLYGKFGQTGQVYEASKQIEDKSCAKFTILDFDTGQLMKCRQLAGLLQVMSTEGEARDSFPAIAAHVTAHARILLWRLIETAGLENCHYCDTDSLFVNTRGAGRLKGWVAPTTLGKLKSIGRWPWLILRGLKDYEYPGVIKRKGVRETAKEIAPGVFEQIQWSSLKGLLGSGDLAHPTRKTITKTLKREYKKPRSV